MPDMHVKVSGTWKTVNVMHVKVSSVWKEITTGYVRVGGVWKEFTGGFLIGDVNLDGENVNFNDTDGFPWSALAAVKMDNDGNMYQKEGPIGTAWSQIDSANDWLRNASSTPGLWEVRATITTGTFIGGTFGSWLAMSGGDRVWENSTTTRFANETGRMDLELRYDGGSIVTSGNYLCQASADL